MSQYKLTYFNGRGRAELSRWIFAAAGQEYDDNRIGFDTWGAGFKQTTPFGSVPILEVEGATIAQSTPIVRFLARRLGLAGSGDVEQARVDMVADCANDVLATYMSTMFAASEECKAANKKAWEESVKENFLARLEKLLISNNGGDGFFIGDKLTYGDLAVAAALNMTEHADWTSYPKLQAHKDKVQAQEGVAKWLSVRPSTPW